MSEVAKQNEVAKKTDNLPATITEEETSLIPASELTEMFGESSLDTTTGLSFNQIAIVRETAQFDMGNDQYVKTLTGHILFKHKANQWWEKPFDERSEDDDPMPQCYSIDSIKPCGGPKMQSDFCGDKICKKDTFGSGKDGIGKACRNTMRFLFLEDGAVLPIIIVSSPTSFGKKNPLQKWLNSVPNSVAKAWQELPDNIRPKDKDGQIVDVVDYWPAHVEMSLEKKSFGDKTASLLCIKTLDVLTLNNNPVKLHLLFKMQKTVVGLYQKEQRRYLETDVNDDEGNTDNDESIDVASDNDNDDIPI